MKKKEKEKKNRKNKILNKEKQIKEENYRKDKMKK